MKKFLKNLNDNHWYLIAAAIAAGIMIWTYGCISTVPSVLHPEQLINRIELDNELQYLIGLVQARAQELDRQDAIKQSLLDAANVISQTGNINPSGLLNIFATIGAISFGLNRNQKVKSLAKQISQ